MNKITHNEFKLMLLRPAIYNGKEFEMEVDCSNIYFHRADINEATAIQTTPGDTVSVYIKCCFENESKSFGEHITMYMCEEALTKFIDRVGFSEPKGKFRVRVKFIYAIYSTSEFDYDESKKEEIIGCKLLKFSPIEDECDTLSTETKDYFMDGMK
jgi:hypothetical protein